MSAKPHPEIPPPALRLSVDRAALAANWRALDAMSDRAATASAVKADAYGVGIHNAMPALLEAGCRDFYVAHWCEVVGALDHCDAASLAVLHGPVNAADCAYARATGVRPVLNSLQQVRIWLESGGGPCDLMVDTGMNRLGLRPEELGDPLVARLEVDVLMSHLACADEDSAANDHQRSAFAAILGTVPHHRASLANSAGIALGEAYRFDLTRPGLALYGGVPRHEMHGKLSQVVTPEAAILQVRHVPAGETVGYGGTYRATRDTAVGIVALGYADGYLRCWSDLGMLRSEGRKLPVIGRVSMDMTAIDLSAAPDLAEGDWVSVEYDLPSAAQKSGLSQYELLTVLGPRIRS
ncbi:alanine racemase [Croceicoccus naphthovorans]|uniref:Alanine racemase n=1 Tax=Croceicoccus naphthovorans TaxID=1348774 RepID=A0A0G3XET3_9SPHN|nr:alanine racemase [Croceicoccus naphthovorans]AKM10020.1 alanine racemase [Croceicoccus naphthovorans]MBB3991099.1 alanine racemase [Croceicoccus naphthovorans]